MSVVTIPINTANFLSANTNRAKLFLKNKRFHKGTFYLANSTYDDVTYPEGTVLGRIAASRRLVPLDKNATDGSQYPVGILGQSVTIAAGDTANQTVAFCVFGDVAKDLLGFVAGTDLDTVIEHKTVFDRIGSDTLGIYLVTTVENTDFDNA